MTSPIIDADNVVGAEVRNLHDERLGKIEAIMLDKKSGRVAYLVLSYGGFLGVGDKLFAMPWSLFAYDADADCFRLALEKDKLKHSPGFDKDHWPDMADAGWSQGIHKYYGINQ